MSGRIFQNVVLQIKDATDRVVGVIDAEGTVISCSDLGLIGRKWPEYAEYVNRAEGALWTAGRFTPWAAGGPILITPFSRWATTRSATPYVLWPASR